MNHPLAGITRLGKCELINPATHAAPGWRSRVRAAVVAPDGTVKQRSPWVENIATTFGLASLASRVGTVSGANANTTTEFVSAMKIGTGNTAAASTDTALVASTGSVTIGNASFTKTNTGNRSVEYRASFASDNPAGAAAITEVGLYLNSTADSQCAARTVLSGASSVNKGASDSIQISYQLIFTTA